MTELLAIVGVIGVLIAIITPVLHAARISAVEHATLAHQRQVGLILAEYSADHRGGFPFWGTPGTTEAPLILEGELIVDSVWGHVTHWAAYAESLGYQEAQAAMTGPDMDEPTLDDYRYLHARDWLTATVYARPTYWRAHDPQLDQDIQLQSWSSIAFPALKGLLLRLSFARIDESAVGHDPTYLAWFADGHGEIRALHSFRPPASLVVPFGRNSTPVITTENGVLGRDI